MKSKRRQPVGLDPATVLLLVMVAKVILELWLEKNPDWKARLKAALRKLLPFSRRRSASAVARRIAVWAESVEGKTPTVEEADELAKILKGSR